VGGFDDTARALGPTVLRFEGTPKETPERTLGAWGGRRVLSLSCGRSGEVCNKRRWPTGRVGRPGLGAELAEKWGNLGETRGQSPRPTPKGLANTTQVKALLQGTHRRRLGLFLSFFVTNWPLREAVYQAWYQARYIAYQW
jgi:hypothetical protein